MSPLPLTIQRLRDWVLRFAGRRMRPWVAVVACMAVALSLWLNLTRQSTPYGTVGGRYEDPVDSSSEYLIRNSVIYGYETDTVVQPNLWVTRGYPDDLDYVRDGIQPYYSHRGLQVAPYTALAIALDGTFEDHAPTFFRVARFVNCLLASAIIFLFFWTLAGGTGLSLIAAVLFAHTTGIALFAANLYHQEWILLLPLAAFPLLSSGRRIAYVLAALISSLLYFLVRYEFATTFALMWMLPPLLAQEKPFRTSALAFLASCGAFAIAITTHHLQVAGALGIPLQDASELILSNLRLRTASLEGVPVPLSPRFFLALLQRWSWPGFSIPLLFTFPAFPFLIAFAWVALRTTVRRERLLLLWALSAYASWYVFGYQHIVQHAFYDSLLFAVTIQLVLLILGTRWCRDRGIGESLDGTAAREGLRSAVDRR